jgi:hypothetical protein
MAKKERIEVPQPAQETKVVDGQVFVVKELKPVRRGPLGIGKVRIAEGSSIAKQRK